MTKVATSLPNIAVSLDKSSDDALYRQLYDQLRLAILSGRLMPGTRLPSSRDLADEFGVARNTVVNAFDQLLAESYLESRVGDGTYVSRQLPDDLLRAESDGHVSQNQSGTRPSLSRWGTEAVSVRTMPGNYAGKSRPFRTSTPAFDEFPYKLWERLLTRRWRESGRDLVPYNDSAGYLPLRTAISSYLNATRGVRCAPEQIIIVSGSQHALELSTKVLLDQRDKVWIEDPGFLGARAVFRALGARITPVPVDSEGLNVAAGKRRCPKPRLIYVTPSHQYPLGMTLSLARRLALLKFASDAGAWIIEDDYDSEFRYVGRPLAALQGLDNEQRVIYVGTLSKVLFPSIRIGYIISPPDLVDAFVGARRLAGHQCPTLEQAVLADFIAEGHFARHIRRMRTLYAERQYALVKAAARELTGMLEVQPSDAGMHLMGWLPDGVNDRTAAKAAKDQGIEVTPLSIYFIEPPARSGLRLGYTGYTPRQISQAVRVLGGVLRTVSATR